MHSTGQSKLFSNHALSRSGYIPAAINTPSGHSTTWPSHQSTLPEVAIGYQSLHCTQSDAQVKVEARRPIRRIAGCGYSAEVGDTVQASFFQGSLVGHPTCMLWVQLCLAPSLLMKITRWRSFKRSAQEVKARQYGSTSASKTRFLRCPFGQTSVTKAGSVSPKKRKPRPAPFNKPHWWMAQIECRCLQQVPKLQQGVLLPGTHFTRRCFHQRLEHPGQPKLHFICKRLAPWPRKARPPIVLSASLALWPKSCD